MDSSNATPIEAGQLWRHNDGSPWPQRGRPVRILEVAPGWVRFYRDDFQPDERIREGTFREFFNELVP